LVVTVGPSAACPPAPADELAVPELAAGAVDEVEPADAAAEELAEVELEDADEPPQAANVTADTAVTSARRVAFRRVEWPVAAQCGEVIPRW
jgi:hypothetical protein